MVNSEKFGTISLWGISIERAYQSYSSHLIGFNFLMFLFGIFCAVGGVLVFLLCAVLYFWVGFVFVCDTRQGGR